MAQLPLVNEFGNPLETRDAAGISLSEYTKLWLAGSEGSSAASLREANAYSTHPWAYANIGAIARTVASIPFRIYNGDTEQTKGDEYDLFQRPEPRKCRYDLWFGTIVQLETNGNALWHYELGRNRNRVPSAIQLLNARSVTVIRNPDTGELEGYKFKPKGSKKVKIVPPDEILHFMYYNPNDPLWGIGSLSAIMSALRTDAKASQYGEDFFNRGAVLAGLLINKRGVSREQMEQMRRSFEDEHAGYDRAHRTAILSGDWEYQPFSVGHRDMEFSEQRRFAREMSGSAFAVPGILTNDPNKQNYSTANIELRIFGENNWLPKVRYIQDMVNAQFFMRFSPKLRGEFDVSEAPGLRENLNEKIDNARKMWQIGVPMNDLIDKLNLPFEKQSWGDTWWVNKANVPARLVDPFFDDPAPPPKKKPDDPNLQITPDDEEPADDVEVKQAFVRGVYKQISPICNKLASRIKRHFFEMRTAILKGESIDLFDADEELANAIRPLIEECLRLGASMLFQEIGRDDEFVLHPSLVEDRVASIVEINSVLLEALKEEDARKVFSVAGNKARSIARQEVASAVNEGRILAMHQCEVAEHRLVDCGDGHSSREVVAVGDNFSFGSPFPICGCFTVAVL